MSGLGPSSRRRRANDAAILKFFSLKKRFRAVLSVRIMWTGCMLQCVKYAAIYSHIHIAQHITNLTKSTDAAAHIKLITRKDFNVVTNWHKLLL